MADLTPLAGHPAWGTVTIHGPRDIELPGTGAAPVIITLLHTEQAHRVGPYMLTWQAPDTLTVVDTRPGMTVPQATVRMRSRSYAVLLPPYLVTWHAPQPRTRRAPDPTWAQRIARFLTRR